MLAAGFGFWKYNDHIKNQENTSPSSITHTVKKGDTLFAISKQYDTTVHSIKVLNNLNSNNIHPGKTLTIHPGDQAQNPTSNTSSKSKINTPTPKPTVKQKPKQKNPPKAQIINETKKITTPTTNKQLIQEAKGIVIDINSKNQVYLKNSQGKLTPSGTIIYGSEPDAEGREVKTITYRDAKGKTTTLRGSATPEDVIRLALSNR